MKYTMSKKLYNELHSRLLEGCYLFWCSICAFVFFAIHCNGRGVLFYPVTRSSCHNFTIASINTCFSAAFILI